ncbi:unnamed protein product, partial [Ascophyllum nodosum]
FDSRCKKIPRKLKEGEVYQVLFRKIGDFKEILRLIENLRKPSIMPRHWQELMSIMKVYFPYDHEGFSFADIMDSPILQHRDDVE